MMEDIGRYEGDKEKKITDVLELMQELIKVKSEVNKNITEDYTLAYLGQAEKEFVTENYSNGEYAKELIERFSKKAYRYIWNEVKSEWEKDENNNYIKEKLSEEDCKKIEKISKRIFEFFMINSHLIAILNRNRNDNFMVKLLGSAKEEEEKPVQYGEDDRNFLQKMWSKMKGDEEYVEEN